MKVIVKKQIHGTFAGASSLDVYVYRELDLPFAPFVGLCISDEGWDNILTLTDIVWNCKRNCFIAYTEDDKEIYNAVLHKEPHRKIEEIVEEYRKQGWLVKERR